ncbi:MAG: hypothetical protein AAGK78_06015, partial [Planctomycetota bacterium]
ETVVSCRDQWSTAFFGCTLHAATRQSVPASPGLLMAKQSKTKSKKASQSGKAAKSERGRKAVARRKKTSAEAPVLTEPSRLIGPEDVAAGQYVTVVETDHQATWIGDAPSGGGEQVWQEHYTARSCAAGWPYKVVTVSLPYVFAKDTDGEPVVMDLRRHRLARLSDAYGKAAFAATKKLRKKKK